MGRVSLRLLFLFLAGLVLFAFGVLETIIVSIYDSEGLKGDNISCTPTYSETSTLLGGLAFGFSLMLFGAVVALASLPWTDYFRDNFYKLDLRPGLASKLNADQSFSRPKTAAGGVITIALIAVYAIFFAVYVDMYLERTDNYQVSATYSPPRLTLQLSQYWTTTNPGLCPYLETVTRPFVNCNCFYDDTPTVEILGCKEENSYSRVDWKIQYSETGSSLTGESCNSVIYQPWFSPDATLYEWKLTSLVQDPYNQQNGKYQFSTVSGSSWNQVVFPHQSFCYLGYANITLLAVPRAQCSTSLGGSDLTPTRASYSLENVLVTRNYNRTFAIMIDQQLPISALCIVDKSGYLSLLAQLISLFGGILGVQAVLRMLLAKFENRRSVQTTDSEPLLNSINKVL